MSIDTVLNTDAELDGKRLLTDANIGAAGSWTPIDGSGAGLSLAVNWATYQYIGTGLIFVTADVVFPTTADTHAVVLRGFPAAVLGDIQIPFTIGLVIAAGGGPVYAYLSATTPPELSFVKADGNVYTNADFSTSELMLVGLYPVAV